MGGGVRAGRKVIACEFYEKFPSPPQEEGNAVAADSVLGVGFRQASGPLMSP